MKTRLSLTAFVNSCVLLSLPVLLLALDNEVIWGAAWFQTAVVIYACTALANGPIFYRRHGELSLINSAVNASIQTLLFALMSVAGVVATLLAGASLRPDNAENGFRAAFILTWPVYYFLAYSFSVSAALAVKGVLNMSKRGR